MYILLTFWFLINYQKVLCAVNNDEKYGWKL